MFKIKLSLADMLKGKSLNANEVCQAILYLFSPENLSKGKYSIIIRNANQVNEDKINQLLVHVDELKRTAPKMDESGIEGGGIRV